MAMTERTTTHTPGPWTWFDYPDGRKLLSALDRAVIHCPDAPISIDVRDQQLLAAAPDLFEALKAILGDIESGLLVRDITRDGDPNWSIEMLAFVKRLQAAQAAIAKAEGRQP